MRERERWESCDPDEQELDARAFVEDLLDALDALSVRLAQAEQERDELRDFFRDVFDGDPQAFVEGYNDLDEQVRRAEAERDEWKERAGYERGRLTVAEVRLREYEEAAKMLSRWCDEDGGSIRGFISAADVRFALAFASGGREAPDTKEPT